MLDMLVRDLRARARTATECNQPYGVPNFGLGAQLFYLYDQATPAFLRGHVPTLRGWRFSDKVRYTNPRRCPAEDLTCFFVPAPVGHGNTTILVWIGEGEELWNTPKW